MGKFIHPNLAKLKKEKQSNPYWITDCTQNIEFKYKSTFIIRYKIYMMI